MQITFIFIAFIGLILIGLTARAVATNRGSNARTVERINIECRFMDVTHQGFELSLRGFVCQLAQHRCCRGQDTKQRDQRISHWCLHAERHGCGFSGASLK